jgi:hypothetical protein
VVGRRDELVVVVGGFVGLQSVLYAGYQDVCLFNEGFVQFVLGRGIHPSYLGYMVWASHLKKEI